MRTTLFFRRLALITLKNLMVYRVRVILTVFGIFFGIVSVIGTFTVNGNVAEMVEAELKKVGDFTLLVGAKKNEKVQLASRHVQSIRQYAPGVSEVIEVTEGDGFLVYSGLNETYASVIGAGHSYFEMKKMKPRAGRVLTAWDASQRTVLLGSRVAEDIFKNENPVGKRLDMKVGQSMVPMTVVGVLDRAGRGVFSSSGENPDDSIYLHINSYRGFLSAAPRIRLIARAHDGQLLESKSQITKLLQAEFGKLLVITDPKEEIENNKKVVDGIVYSGIGIGILALISGGIGIMNIMLVSVLQRRREIGLYKAIGFSDRVILLQFIAEAVMICLLGSVFGLICGIPVGLLISAQVLDGFAKVNVPSLFISVGFALGTGLLFGYLPAKRAAEMDPVEALKG